MPCTKFKTSLDDYCDGLLPPEQKAARDSHLAECQNCQRLLARETKLRELLQNYGASAVPMPTDAWFDEALANASSDGEREGRNRWLTTGVAAALVASVAAWIVSSALLDVSPVVTPRADIPSVTMTLAKPQTVNLLFSSATELNDAELTLLLPPGVSLAGFEGQREVTWRTSLSAGRNVLPLTLTGQIKAEGELQAILTHGDEDRAFRVLVRVTG